jgi:hypothetical protein
MTSDNYQTVFELGFRTFPWPRIIQPFFFLIGGIAIIKLSRRNKFRFVFGVFLAGMASLFLLLSLVTFVPEFIGLRAAYRSGKSVAVEGTVQDLSLAPALGPSRESFSVSGTSFSYNALDDTPCFHNAPVHLGPIQEGLNVRIHYYERCIQRVEVLQSAAGNSSNAQK